MKKLKLNKETISIVNRDLQNKIRGGWDNTMSGFLSCNNPDNNTFSNMGPCATDNDMCNSYDPRCVPTATGRGCPGGC